MIKILAIGNSFSEDATHYLYQMAQVDNVDMKVVNLNIGGCSLEQHWNNIRVNASEYRYEENGNVTDVYRRDEIDSIIDERTNDCNIQLGFNGNVKNLKVSVTKSTVSGTK